MKYFIDYGHGGDDPGAIGENVLEKNINKLVGERVKFHLERHGQTVILTRVNDESVSLQERVNIINKNNCDLGISIHCNSFSDTSVQGIETYTWGNKSREKLLAEKVHKEIIKAKLCYKNRGLKESQFTILSPDIPCCLVELGFISNESDRKLILDNIENFAIAITKGLLAFYEISYKKQPDVPIESVKKEDAEDGKYYRVQVGAYKTKQYAIDLAESLKKQGYPAIINYY